MLPLMHHGSAEHDNNRSLDATVLYGSTEASLLPHMHHSSALAWYLCNIIELSLHPTLSVTLEAQCYKHTI